jgi:hypothetical protein
VVLEPDRPAAFEKRLEWRSHFTPPMPAEYLSEEAEQFWRYIKSSLSDLLDLVAGQDDEVIRWRPPAHDANSIIILARHTLANAGVNILHTLGGLEYNYDREANFGEHISRDEVLATWTPLCERLDAVMRTLPQERIDEPVPHHWRGEIPGREVLIIVARHTAEHLAHARLTADLAAVALGR